MNLVQETKQVVALSPVTTNAANTGDYVSLKNAGMAFVEVFLTQAAAHATVISIEQATVVAGTDSKVITNAVPIWANEDIASSDTLTRETTDAVNYTVDADIKNKHIVFQIDPATLDLANGFDCITVKTSASSEATNFVCAKYTLSGYRYQGDNTPSAIVD